MFELDGEHGEFKYSELRRPPESGFRRATQITRQSAVITASKIVLVGLEVVSGRSLVLSTGNIATRRIVLGSSAFDFGGHWSASVPVRKRRRDCGFPEIMLLSRTGWIGGIVDRVEIGKRGNS